MGKAAHHRAPREAVRPIPPLGESSEDRNQAIAADLQRHFDHTIRVEITPDRAPAVFVPDVLKAFGSQDLPQALQTFGEYELLAEIARGGMGVVYKAQQLRLGRIVALKMILAGRFADERQVKQLHAEAQVVARLQHPNIVAIHEVGEHEGRHYFSMDYVDGKSLADLVRRQPLLMHHAARVVHTLSEAIHYAHGQGVLHRDLKPSNVLIDRTGQPRITDFGVAKLIGNESANTTAGRILGTPSYMPPEQAAGRNELVGPASDVYSLGAILYELLTGRPPFQAATAMDVLLQVHEKEPVAPQLLNPKVPRDLQTICLKCLEKDPRKRYQTANDLAQDLRRFLAGEPIAARPLRLWERSGRWARRNPAAAFLIGVITAAVLSLQASSIWYQASLNEGNSKLQNALSLAHRQQNEAQRQRETAERQQLLAHNQRHIAQQQQTLAEYREQIARQHLYAMQAAQLQQAWELADVGRVLELLDLQRPHPGQSDLRGFEWFYYWNQCHSERATLRGHQAALSAVAHAPDGRLVATASHDGTVRLWRMQPSGIPVENAEPRVLASHNVGALCLAFTADGQRLVSGGRDGQVTCWEVSTGICCGSFQAHSGSVLSLALNTDPPLLATGGADQRIRYWNRNTWQPLGDSMGHANGVLALKFSPEGKLLASAGGDHKVRVWRVHQRTEQAVLTGHEGPVHCLQFQDEDNLLSGSADGTLRLWRIRQANLKALVQPEVGPITSLSVSAAAELVAVGSAGRRLAIVSSSTWKTLTTLRGHTASVSGVSFAPGGQLLASASLDGTAKLWRSTVRQPSDTLSGLPGEVHCLAFAPCEPLLALGIAGVSGSNSPSSVQIRNVETNQVLRTLAVPSGHAAGLAFSPDGELLAIAANDPAGEAGQLTVHEVATGALVLHAPGAFNQVAFCPAGRTLFAVGETHEVLRWDVTERMALTPFVGHEDENVGISFAGKSCLLATSSLDETVRIWDGMTGEVRRTLVRHRTHSPVAFSPAGDMLATSRAQQVTPQSIPPGWERSISADLLPSSPIGQVSLLDAATGEEKFVLRGHSRTVQTLAFSPDGRRLATGGRDAQIKLWDTATGHPLATLIGHENVIYDLCFSADGNMLVSAASDGTVRLWNARDERKPSEPPTNPTPLLTQAVPVEH